MEKTTLKDIAQRVGVTEMTVSSALRNTGRISPERRRQVIAVADELGYRPNAAARSIRSGRFGSLALLVSREHPTPVTTELLGSLELAMSKRNLHLILSHVPDAKLVDAAFIPQILRESMADGLLIKHDVNIPDVMVDLIERHRIRIPSVWLNSKHTSNCVYFDEFDAGRAATVRLLDLGHRRIAYFSRSKRSGLHYSVIDRFDGYVQAMRDAGLKPEWLDAPRQGAFSRPDRLAAIEQRLGGSDRPTAIVADSTTTARITLLAAARLGLEPGSDVSIISFSDAPLDDGGIPVDVMIAPVSALGTQSVEMLLAIIDDRTRTFPSLKLSYTPCPGQTCTPPA